MRPLALTVGLLTLAAGPAIAETHPFTVHDLLAMDRIADPQVSPDGQKVIFTVSSTDLEANRRRTDLWSVPSRGGEVRRLTTHEAGDHHARWAPDGTSVYFLSSRSGSSQVWRLPLAGGEAQQVTRLPLDVSGFVVSPDGTSLVVGVSAFPECETLQCSADRFATKKPASGKVYERLFVRHWDTWRDGARNALVAVPTAGSGDPVLLTRGFDRDAPTMPFGGFEEVTFAPGGAELVFVARDPIGSEEAWSTDLDLWAVPLDGSAAPRNLTPDNDAVDTQPVFSPDGKSLAWLAMSRPGFEADRLRILIRAWPDGVAREVAPTWDRSAGDLAFSPDGKTLYVTAGNIGNVSLFAIDVAKGTPTVLVEKGHARSPQVAGDRLIYGWDTLSGPVELFSMPRTGGAPTQLTTINRERTEATRRGAYEQFSFKGWNDETVYGYVVKPADLEPGKKYPIAFLIHGGPQGSFGNDFHYRWNPQTYAGAGYAAVMIDFHGSTGYGQAFTDSISQDWGGKPLVDLQKGLEAAIARYDFLDGDRACALGASYGGYMINWIAGNWPDRFRCLVNHDGVFDNRAMAFETEELWFDEWEFGGTYWDNPEGYERHNPALHVDKWKTPMMVVHGALDYRVVDTQGIAAFTALQRRGIPSKFLYFPDENHWVLKPQNSIQWHDEVLEWLGRWLGE